VKIKRPIEPTPTRFQRMQLAQPWCIYCGGATRGTSIDHVPPKTAFDFKHRPKGMEYMSCEPCRKGSERIDQVAGFFARLYSVKPGTKKHIQELRKIIRGVGNNVPEVLKEMKLDEVLRGARHDVHTVLPDAAAIFSVGPIASSYLTAFGARVALALHYEVTRQILPVSGAIFVHWMSNNVMIENEVPEQFLAMLGPPQSLVQGSKFTSEDQFLYKSREENNGARSAHFVTFRMSFAFQAFVVRDFAEMKHIVNDLPSKVFRPGFLEARI
jgi:hypothetical protein